MKTRKKRRGPSLGGYQARGSKLLEGGRLWPKQKQLFLNIRKLARKRLQVQSPLSDRRERRGSD